MLLLKLFMLTIHYRNLHRQYHFIIHKSINLKYCLHTLKSFILKIYTTIILKQYQAQDQTWWFETFQIIAKLYRLWILLEFESVLQ